MILQEKRGLEVNKVQSGNCQGTITWATARGRSLARAQLWPTCPEEPPEAYKQMAAELPLLEANIVETNITVP